MIGNKLSKPWIVAWRTILSRRAEPAAARGGYTEVWAKNKTEAKQRFRRELRLDFGEKLEIISVGGQVGIPALGYGTGDSNYERQTRSTY